MKRPRKLSARLCATATIPDGHLNRDGEKAKMMRFGDGRRGHGLALQVTPALRGGFAKSWTQRLRIDGKVRHLGLGAYPKVSLREARKRALANAQDVAEGRDPRKIKAVPTFEEAAEAVIELHRPTYKHPRTADQWAGSLRDYVYPKIGKKSVAEISTADVLSCLAPSWNERRNTLVKVRQRISAVLKWSIAQGHRTDDPMIGVGSALPRGGAPKTPQRALPHGEVARSIETVRNSGANFGTKLALEYLVLTGTRSGEVRGATWEEIDLEARTWTIPAERMKAGREHRVPLSDRAVAVLEEARPLSGGEGMIFPSLTGRQLSGGTLSRLLRDLGIDGVPHGYRASFRTWASEMTNTPHAVMEAALAHTVSDAVERAYSRSDFFARRRELMGAWAAYLNRESADVANLHEQRTKIRRNG